MSKHIIFEAIRWRHFSLYYGALKCTKLFMMLCQIKYMALVNVSLSSKPYLGAFENMYPHLRIVHIQYVVYIWASLCFQEPRYFICSTLRPG